MLIFLKLFIYSKVWQSQITVNYENIIPNSEEKHSYLSNTTTMEFRKRMTHKCRSNTHSPIFQKLLFAVSLMVHDIDLH